MKKLLKSITLVLTIITLSVSTTSFAHSGRTDGSGGHKDNKNKSGLGYYHYHCGGNPPHLHTNGICPYSSYSVSSTASSNGYTSATTYTPAPNPTINLSNIRTFINGCEIPTFEYSGTIGIIAEDLVAYGFDVTWNGSSRSLKIVNNPDKTITPIPMDYYRSIGIGNKFCEATTSNISVFLNPQGTYTTYYPSKKYNANGYTFISVDDLSNYGEFIWNGNAMTIDIILPRN